MFDPAYSLIMSNYFTDFRDIMRREKYVHNL